MCVQLAPMQQPTRQTHNMHVARLWQETQAACTQGRARQNRKHCFIAPARKGSTATTKHACSAHATTNNCSSKQSTASKPPPCCAPSALLPADACMSAPLFSPVSPAAASPCPVQSTFSKRWHAHHNSHRSLKCCCMQGRSVAPSIHACRRHHSHAAPPPSLSPKGEAHTHTHTVASTLNAHRHAHMSRAEECCCCTPPHSPARLQSPAPASCLPLSCAHASLLPAPPP